MKVTIEELRYAIDNSTSMAEAATKLKLHFSTFKGYAIKCGLYVTNQGGKGTSKNRRPDISLEEILDGKHPQFQTYKLKHRLYKQGLKKNECEECGITSWNGKEIQCELDHIDGDRTNHRFNNLKILCPNCHSQTDTFRFKRGKE
jgi:5-methylcytosine-specific restriction endonuclease McrA